MTAYVVEHVFRNERSDLDRVYLIRPKGHPDNPDPDHGVRVTLRDHLAETAGRLYFYRDDVLLINAVQPHCATCTCEDHPVVQFAVHARKDGSLVGPPEAFELASAEDLEWAREEAARMVATAATHDGYRAAFLRY